MVFQPFDFVRPWWRLFQKRPWWRLFQKRPWWRLFQKRVVRTTFDIYVLIRHVIRIQRFLQLGPTVPDNNYKFDLTMWNIVQQWLFPMYPNIICVVGCRLLKVVQHFYNRRKMSLIKWKIKIQCCRNSFKIQ
jgi:hypothetical protein